MLNPRSQAGPPSDVAHPGGIREVLVRTGAGDTYPVRIGPGAIDELPALLRERVAAHRYALVSDDRVMGLHGGRVLSLLEARGLRVERFLFPAGEANKRRDEWTRLTDALLNAGIGRDGCILALGGGVTGDLAGFVAATFMRGIPVVQLPTSLVAMVDSSVGGKTGIDLPAGKNLVGAFHPPRFVLADTRLARTLPRSERSQGLAEAVKHGAIRDADYLAEVHRDASLLLDGDEEATGRMVRRSVEIKAEVVSRDEREEGLREILNFGHTLGHALEAASGYGLPHGSAVSLGMVLEARLGEVLGATEAGTADRLRDVLEAVGLPVDLPDGVDLEAVRAHLVHDKKARDGEVRFVLLARAGEVAPARATEAVAEGGAKDPIDGGRAKDPINGGRAKAPAWSRSVPGDAVAEVLASAAESSI